ncbi:Heat shock protein 15 [Candidatus Nitrotoga sp. HW29]|uniref:RNA-binding S4 domain-containing protein n=1 Tax=Candidatus Nitrotoga sp. HW29 TaxID=2886963 RepID=UPI001EF3B5A3|nr:RNA-binding S4 domain-containing protein [Candidatus Nitrotoga sp. HW29]CAH1906239.1 Heat shock protein 15 [Candidatus Nitrotoga sp. HW29]
MNTFDEKNDNAKFRIDKWLWAARFFKTRSLSVDALECGKVLCNGVRVKPAKSVAIGDMLSIRIGPYQFLVEVLALSSNRGPASQAQMLYKETEESFLRRKAQSDELKAQPMPTFFRGRPTKRDRREIEKLKGSVW